MIKHTYNRDAKIAKSVNKPTTFSHYCYLPNHISKQLSFQLL